MNLITMYEDLKSKGYVSDQYNFDREWLGRKPGYTAYIRSTSRAPSLETLFKFYLRLMKRGDTENRFGINGDYLHGLAEEVFDRMRGQIGG